MGNHNAIELQAARLGKTVDSFLLSCLNDAGSIEIAAEKLGVSYPTLWKAMRKHQIVKVNMFIRESEILDAAYELVDKEGSKNNVC